MRMDPAVKRRIIRNALLSLLFYALPTLLMLTTLSLQGKDLWSHPAETFHGAGLFWAFCDLFSGNGFIVFIVALGLAEFTLGRYGAEWRGNETVVDLVCFALPHLVFAPFFAWFSLHVLPFVLPYEHNLFNWVPFFWGVLILCVADDLTQYWYHRLHHEVPRLWRFHRTHHSASYMGMSMARRGRFPWLLVEELFFEVCADACFGKTVSPRIRTPARSACGRALVPSSGCGRVGGAQRLPLLHAPFHLPTTPPELVVCSPARSEAEAR